MAQAQSATNKATGNIEKGLNKVDSALKKVAKVAAAYISVKALVSFSKSCVQLGSDLSEVQNVVDVTFGSMSKQIDAFSKAAIKQFGLSETAAKKYSSTMGAMLKSMGMSTDQAFNMSTTLAGLAGDLASFYNLTTDEAFAKLRSGISGETEPLKQLGINLSVANLEAYALSQGITKSYNAMTQAEQATLRYNYLLKATSDAQGDFARTSGSWANQVKILRMQFDSMKASLGQGFIMALTPVIKVLNRVMERLTKLANTFKVVMAIITGQDLNETVQAQASSAVSSDMAEDMVGISDAAQNTADSVGGITDNLKDADKAAKRFLMSFDEIHKLQSDDDNNGLTLTSDSLDIQSIGELITPDAIDGVNYAEETLEGLNGTLGMSQEEIERLRTKLAPVIEFIGNVKEKISDLGDTVKAWWDEHAPQFQEAWNNDIKPTLQHWGEKLDELWTDHLQPMLAGVGLLVTALWENILKPFVQWFADVGFDKIVDTLGDVSDLVGGFGQFLAGGVNGLVGAGKFVYGGLTDNQEIMDAASKQIVKAMDQTSTGSWRMLGGAGSMGAGIMDLFTSDPHWRDDWQARYNSVTTPWGVSQDYKDWTDYNAYGNGDFVNIHDWYADGYQAQIDYDRMTQSFLDALNNADTQDINLYMDAELVGEGVVNSMSFRNIRNNPDTGWITR